MGLIALLIMGFIVALPFAGVFIIILTVRDGTSNKHWEARKYYYFDNKFDGKKTVTMNFSEVSSRPSAQEAVEAATKRGYRVDSTVPVGGSTTLVFKKL